MLRFTINQKVTVDEFKDVLIRSTLGARRPVDDRDCLQGMIANSNLIATCWNDDLLVGIARSVTDFYYCCYLSDLAVDTACQRQGIGIRLIQITQKALKPRCKIILLSAPDAVEYYLHIGFKHHPQAWMLEKDRRLKVKELKE